MLDGVMYSSITVQHLEVFSFNELTNTLFNLIWENSKEILCLTQYVLQIDWNNIFIKEYKGIDGNGKSES